MNTYYALYGVAFPPRLTAASATLTLQIWILPELKRKRRAYCSHRGWSGTTRSNSNNGALLRLRFSKLSGQGPTRHAFHAGTTVPLIYGERKSAWTKLISQRFAPPVSRPGFHVHHFTSNSLLPAAKKT